MDGRIVGPMNGPTKELPNRMTKRPTFGSTDLRINQSTNGLMDQLTHQGKETNIRYNMAGYTATSCGRVGRGGNTRFHNSIITN